MVQETNDFHFILFFVMGEKIYVFRILKDNQSFWVRLRYQTCVEFLGASCVRPGLPTLSR